MSDPDFPNIKLNIRLREAWSDNIFAEIETRGGVKLNPQQRQAVQTAVEGYEEATRERRSKADAAKERKLLDGLIESLDKIISVLESREEFVTLLFWSTRLSRDGEIKDREIRLDDEIRRFKLLRRHFAYVRGDSDDRGGKPIFCGCPDYYAG